MEQLPKIEVAFADCEPMPKDKAFTFDAFCRASTQQKRAKKDRITGEEIPDRTVQLLYLRDKRTKALYVTRSEGLVRQFDQVREEVENLDDFTVIVREQKLGSQGEKTWRFARPAKS